MYIKSLTLIVPLNNSREYLDTLLDTFLDNSSEYKQKFEVILVDDGSQDDTYKYLTKYYSKYNIFNIMKQNAKGEGGALNLALKSAKGKYIKILRPEDSLDKDAFHNILNFVEANEYDLIIHGYKLFNRDRNEKKDPSHNGFAFLKRGEVKEIGSNVHLSYMNMIYRTKIFKEKEFKAIEGFQFSDMYTSIWFARQAKTLYSLEDTPLYEYTVTKKSEKISLENYINNQQDYWKVLSIILTEIDPLNEKTHDFVVNSVYKYALFDLAIVCEKNKEPWQKHFERIINLVEKNVYLFEDYKGSILYKKTMNGKKSKFEKFSTHLLKKLETIRML